MVDEASLEMNVLSFREKSFSFDRSITVDGVVYALFHRTEVESESKFRPKVVRLNLAVPMDAIIEDLASETLVLAPDGKAAGPRRPGTAVEVAAEESAFREQGIEFVRATGTDGAVLYLPKAAAERLRSAL